MADTTISALTQALSAKMAGTAVIPLDDTDTVTKKSSLATLRTVMFAGSTGYTATDPLVCGAITTSGDFTLATNKFTVASASGNTVIAGTVTSAGSVFVTGSGVAHGMTDLLATNVAGAIATVSAADGGAIYWGLSDTDAVGIRMIGVIGTASPTTTTPAIALRGSKKNGTTYQALAATETALLVQNLSTTLITVLGSGNTTFVGNIAITGAASTQAAGVLSIGGTQQTTVGAAGGASALPATPTGYIKCYIGSTQFVIPYYAQA